MVGEGVLYQHLGDRLSVCWELQRLLQKINTLLVLAHTMARI